MIGFNDYFGWFHTTTPPDRSPKLGAFLDSLRSCHPHEAMIVSEFGLDANHPGRPANAAPTPIS